MGSRRIIERLFQERTPKPTFVRLVGLLGMFLGIVISGYDFEGSLPSLIIGVVIGYYIAEHGALFLYRRRPKQLAISDRLGVWAVRILCLVCGLGSIVIGSGLLAQLVSMRKYPHKPLDEMAWYALSGRLYRLLPQTDIQPPRSE